MFNFPDIDVPDLKPCPFCGSSTMVRVHLNEDGDKIKLTSRKTLSSTIVCFNCGAFYVNLRQSDYPKLQVEEWNRRVADDSL